MTAQKAAHELLTELKRPMTAVDLANLALDRKLVFSNAKKKVDSIASTIEKNVRDETYNNPKLKFVYGANGTRMLALPEWEDHAPLGKNSAATAVVVALKAEISTELLAQLQLAAQSKIADGFESTVALLLRRGLAAEATNIREGLMKQLKELDASEKGVS